MAKNVIPVEQYIGDVGKQIRKQRKIRNLTQEQLAETVGGSFSAKNLSRNENGETQMGIITYFEIAKALGVSPNDLAPQELLSASMARAGPEDYYELDEDDRKIINTMIAMLLKNRKSNNNTVQSTEVCAVLLLLFLHIRGIFSENSPNNVWP